MKSLIFIIPILSVLALIKPEITGLAVHAVLGLTLGVLLLARLYQNRFSLIRLKDEKLPSSNLFQAIISLLLLVALIITAVSGIIETLNYSNLYNSGDVLQRLHSASAYWLFLLIGIYTGIGFTETAPGSFTRLHKNRFWPFLMTGIFAFALYGAFYFNAEHIINIMLMISPDSPILDLNSNLVLVIFNNAAMLTLWSFLGYQLYKFLLYKSEHKV